MAGHVKVIAALRIVFGGLGVIAALVMLAVFGGIAGIVGINAPSDDAAVAVPVLGAVGGVIFLFITILSLPSIIAGVGLLSFRPWARILTIIISAIDLINFPIGTALGFYGLWVLLSQEGTALFTQQTGSLPPYPVRRQ
jgi:hypothetical protein